jgi:hypothetical protein
MTKPNHGPQRLALEVTLAGDAVFSDPVHAGTIALARSLADELDAQTAAGAPQTRTQATYAGQLNALGRIVRDARDLRRREESPASKSASRLTLIKAQAAHQIGISA